MFPKSKSQKRTRALSWRNWSSGASRLDIHRLCRLVERSLVQPYYSRSVSGCYVSPATLKVWAGIGLAVSVQEQDYGDGGFYEMWAV